MYKRDRDKGERDSERERRKYGHMLRETCLGKYFRVRSQRAFGQMCNMCSTSLFGGGEDEGERSTNELQKEMRQRSWVCK